MVSDTTLCSPVEIGTGIVGKTSGCLCRSETFLVLGLFGAFERKAMVEGSERTKKMKVLRLFFARI